MNIGIIGLGDMGKLYARTFAKAGYHVRGCDVPAHRSKLEEELSGTGIEIVDTGSEVSRRSDFIMYAVETENIEKAVAQAGAATRVGAIVGGQTSVKTPEIRAFEKYLPSDVHIVTCHSLHAPSVPPTGQTLAVIRHRSSDEAYSRALDLFGTLRSRIVELSSYEEHDRITADTQAATHVAFESMGTAWKNAGFYPWENTAYTGGLDNIKALMTVRIFSGKVHVYAGLALFNPIAWEQIQQYARSESELFKLMIQEDASVFEKRIYNAGEYVFGKKDNPLILLDDATMGEFSLGMPEGAQRPNSHLSLLAMVDSWHQLGVNPYQNMICQTPIFRLRLGIAEYLFKHPVLLKESIDAALFDKRLRGDDLEFHNAVRQWSSLISDRSMRRYEREFEAVKLFFKDRSDEGKLKSNLLIQRLAGR
ncbi:prephenate dehydrogenase [Candidatus Pacearchaeota archaeon]|nr:prephenate dehydrogenase [Candidatus Pacearchaeota archaeon]